VHLRPGLAGLVENHLAAWEQSHSIWKSLTTV